ncbi:MAG TPA: sulfotransferase family protein [Acetobacteraceae bacterium]|jgi:sulfotransferase|nr:sulfotransferase family protein [Acetobacteraceae bacterium]
MGTCNWCCLSAACCNIRFSDRRTNLAGGGAAGIKPILPGPSWCKLRASRSKGGQDVQNGIHFISGLPRAGSTLLSALLRQNPRFSAGMTSPVGSIFNAMLAVTSARNEGAVFIADDQRQRLLRACFDSYYANIHPTQVVFDTNRQWTTKLPALVRLFPRAKVICCVRNPAWVIDSIENLIRRNAFELSGIFNFEPGGTVYSRVEGVSKGDGMAGFAWNALREAVYGQQADRLVLVRYESLTTNPLGTLARIYEAIGEPLFAHDPENLEEARDMLEFDLRLGTPGLHHVRSAVRPEKRLTVLPPDLFAKFERDAFWEDLTQIPASVRVI